MGKEGLDNVGRDEADVEYALQKGSSNSSGKPIESTEPIDPEADRKLLLKLDFLVFPVFSVIFTLGLLDRINIGNARIQGMAVDLDLHGNRFNVVLLVFYVSYILFEIPSNMLIKKVRPSIYISSLMFIWGIITLCMGFVQSYEALVGLRFLLGIFEAGVLPGIIYVTAMYYKRHEYQKRMSFFISSTVIAGAFGGLLAYLITTQLGGRHGIAGWRWIFIVEGALTSGLAILSAFLIIDWPEQTRFLNAEEKDLLRRRLASEGGDLCRMDHLNKFTFKLIIFDYKIWLGGIVYMGISLAGQSATSFLPTILTEFNWSPEQAQIHTIPVYAVALGMMVSSAWISDRLQHRFGFIIGGICIATVGYIMLLIQEGKSREFKFGSIFLILGGVSMITPMALVWLQNNISGHWKRSFGASIQVALGNIAGIIGSVIFISSEAPRYPTAYGVSMSLMWASALSAIIMSVLMMRENKKRAAGERDDRLLLPEEVRENLGDNHPSFRFTM